MRRVQSCPDFGRTRLQMHIVDDAVGVPMGHARSDLGEDEIETNRVVHSVELGYGRGFDWDLLDVGMLNDQRKTSNSECWTSSGVE
jgi:hypothetical protein